jgi:hypothetical protein
MPIIGGNFSIEELEARAYILGDTATASLMARLLDTDSIDEMEMQIHDLESRLNNCQKTRANLQQYVDRLRSALT